MRKSTLKSLMEFNDRVLYYGDPRNNKINPLFFNQIFMSNTDEMFEKYEMKTVLTYYGICLGRCIRNINAIIRKSGIELSNRDCFEQRFAAHCAIDNKMITVPMSVDVKFQTGIIYYLGTTSNGTLTCSYIDPKMGVYNEPISCDSDKITYWKTDQSIVNYLKSVGYASVVPVRVVLKRGTSTVSKIEFNGDMRELKPFLKFIPSSTIVVRNQYLYTNDIAQIIDTDTSSEQQVYRHIEALDLIDTDELIEYPNDSFNDYLWFLRSAIANPETKEIYLTLYRIGSDPTIYYLIRRAVASGIKVFVNVELFASGEETINRMWALELMKTGATVVSFGAGRFKVHSKITLVKFNNGRSIVQVGTGNYHTKTTMQYTDLSFMTGDEDICHQVEKLFKLLTTNRQVSFNNSLLVTQFNSRQRLIKLIDNEAHKNGYICIKCNSLDDEEIISHLEKAANKGCEMDLIIRGICTWVPDSKRVVIKSVVWSKLEHSRVFLFGRHDPTVYLGSLDLLSHKIDCRIETLVLIKNPDIVSQICDYLNRYVADTENSWVMNSEGVYYKLEKRGGK